MPVLGSTRGSTRPSADPFLFYCVLFIVSGATALAYEVLWLRRLALVFGATAAAASATLGSFMAGLGIGGYVGGRVLASGAAPLRLYGILELALAATALAVDALFGPVTDLASAFYGSAGPGPLTDLGRVLLSTALLLVPTVLMGATLPLLAQAVVRSPGIAARRIGLLYGCNTLGGAIGAFLVGFVLIASRGMTSTLSVVAALNALVGVAALVARTGLRGAAVQQDDSRPVSSPMPPASLPGPAWLMLAAIGLSGFAALAAEVVWTRTLVFFTGSTTYAFTIMLTVFLAGLAAGSLLVARAGDRVQRHYRAVGVVFAVVAISLVVGLLAAPRIALLFERWALPDPTWSRNVLAMAAIAVSVLLIPAAGFGAIFPLVARAELLRGRSAGLATGLGYACNVCGAVTGAYLAGFVLVPLFGLSGALRLVAAVLLTCAALLLRLESAAPRRRLLPLAALASAAAVWWIPAVPLHRPPPGETVVYYTEGTSATVSVLRDQTGAKTLYIDRISVAGTDPVMQTDQKSLAHLPMLLHPEPKRVLTVGFGSGGASWSYTRYKELERIDAVEIAREVVGAAPHLREANHDLFSDPRYRIVFDDARSYLQHTTTQYDVIATDCTDLRYKGNASLYTSNYFDLCRTRLRPKGLVIVWMPLGGVAMDDFRLALNTFASIFEYVSVWYMNNYPTHYLLLVGSAEPHEAQWDRLLERLDDTAVRGDLESIGMSDPFRLLASFLMDDAHLRRFVAGSAVNSDEYPRLEFRAPRSADLFSGARNLQALLDATASGPVVPPFAARYGDAQRRTIRARLAPYLRAAARLNRGHVKYQSGLQDFHGALAEYGEAARANPADRHIPELIRAVESTRDLVLASYRDAARRTPEDPAVLYNLGQTLLAAARYQDAADVFGRLTVLRPSSADAHLGLSRAALPLGDAALAARAIDRAVALAPAQFEVQFQRGLVLDAKGDSVGALAAFQRASALKPDSAEAQFNAGTALTVLGRLAEARAAYDAGLRLDPGESRARVNYARILLLLGDRGAATRELTRVVQEAQPGAEEARRLLASVGQ